jgi:hypothetical protein
VAALYRLGRQDRSRCVASRPGLARTFSPVRQAERTLCGVQDTDLGERLADKLTGRKPA